MKLYGYNFHLSIVGAFVANNQTLYATWKKPATLIFYDTHNDELHLNIGTHPVFSSPTTSNPQQIRGLSVEFGMEIAKVILRSGVCAQPVLIFAPVPQQHSDVGAPKYIGSVAAS